MVFVDKVGRIMYANPASGRLVGLTVDLLAGINVFSLIHTDDWDRVQRDFDDVVNGRESGEPVEHRIRAADGSWKTVRAIASNLLDLAGNEGILVGAIDVTEQREQEVILKELAERDATTGLPNRLALRRYLDDAMRSDKPVSVAFVDLDHFRRINDCLGHNVGDHVLRAVAGRLSPLVPQQGLITHFGADTFVVVWSEPERIPSTRFAWELLSALRNILFVAGHELRLSASVGVAVSDATSTPESILRDADVALTRAKRNGRGGVEMFTGAMRSEAIEHLAFETDLRHAIERLELEVWFQPVVSLSHSKLAGHEALLRWIRPNSDTVCTSTLVRVAEDTGLISQLSDQVLSASITALKRSKTPRVSVNLSPRQLLDPGLSTRVVRMLTKHKVDPRRLAFEITESVVIDNFQLAQESLHQLRTLGCSIGLDDFGTGYSSLSYLRKLSVDFLKLDRSLVEDIDADDQAFHIADTIVTLAKALSLTTIAEGVEQTGHAEALRRIGCDFGQGWLYGQAEPL